MGHYEEPLDTTFPLDELEDRDFRRLEMLQDVCTFRTRDKKGRGRLRPQLANAPPSRARSFAARTALPPASRPSRDSERPWTPFPRSPSAHFRRRLHQGTPFPRRPSADGRKWRAAPAHSGEGEGRPAREEVEAESDRGLDSISRPPSMCGACAVLRRRAEDGGGGVCEEALLRGREGDGGPSRGSTRRQPWRVAAGTVSPAGAWHHSSSRKRRAQALMA